MVMKTAKGGHATSIEVDRPSRLSVKLDTAIIARRFGGGDTFTIEAASIAGFSIRSSVPFEQKSVHHFRVSGADGQMVLVGAVCRYCTGCEGSDPTSYVVGFELEPAPARRVELILGVMANDAP